MEVLVGSTSYAASTAYVIDQTKDGSSSSPCLFLNHGDEEEDGAGEIRKRIGSSSFLGKSPEEESSSDNSGSSSSIGAPGDSEDEEEEEDEVSSQARGLTSLDALEDSLPIKRGLSNHYTGKSKSFGNLSDVSLSSISVKDLVEKPENALNKRRRVLIANKWARKSFYSWQNPKSMPLLASLNEDDDDDDDDYCNNKEQIGGGSNSSSSNSRSDQQGVHKLKKHPFSFKSQSCFALADLQEEDDEDDDDDQ